MKCQAWVDQTKFNKRTGRPTTRSLIGTYALDWVMWLEQRGGKNSKRLMRAAEIRRNAIRCGGWVEFSVYSGCDCESYSCGGCAIEITLQCADCGVTQHPFMVDEDTVTCWVQERLDKES